MPAVAATSPPVLIAYLAAQTDADPARLRRRDAAQPRAAGGRRAVRAAGGRRARPHRPRHRPRARLRPRDVDRAARRRGPRRHRHRELPAVPRRRRGADEHQRRPGRTPPQPARPGLRPQGHARRGQRAAAVAARLVDVLRAPGRRQGPAVRVRPPLLRAGHRGGAGRLPLGVPAQRPGRRTHHVHDRQRLRRAHPRGGRGADAAQPAHDGAAAHRPAAAGRSTSSRTPRPRS